MKLGLASIVRVASGLRASHPGTLPDLHILTLYICLNYIPAMDTRFVLQGITFVWDSNKVSTNRRTHGIPVEQAAEAFFDPFLKVVDASRYEEARDAIRIISARKATRRERAYYEA